MSRQLIQVENKVWSQAEIEQGEKERKEFMNENRIPVNKDLNVVRLIQAFKKAKAQKIN